MQIRLGAGHGEELAGLAVNGIYTINSLAICTRQEARCSVTVFRMPFAASALASLNSAQVSNAGHFRGHTIPGASAASGNFRLESGRRSESLGCSSTAPEPCGEHIECKKFCGGKKWAQNKTETPFFKSTCFVPGL